jgi:hypothetical protein
MMALLRKDIGVARWNLPLAVVVFMLLSAQLVRYDGPYLVAGAGLACALTLLAPFFEWMRNGDRLLASLPVRRTDIVAARYVVAALSVAIALVVWGAWGRLLLPLVDPGRSAPALWGTPEGQVAFVLVAWLALAVLLPLTFALGLGRAVVAFVAVWVSLALIYLLAAGTPGHPIRAVGSALTALNTAGGPIVTAAAGAAACAAMLAASAWLAVRAYERREL